MKVSQVLAKVSSSSSAKTSSLPVSITCNTFREWSQQQERHSLQHFWGPGLVWPTCHLAYWLFLRLFGQFNLNAPLQLSCSREVCGESNPWPSSDCLNLTLSGSSHLVASALKQLSSLNVLLVCWAPSTGLKLRILGLTSDVVSLLKKDSVIHKMS